MSIEEKPLENIEVKNEELHSSSTNNFDIAKIKENLNTIEKNFGVGYPNPEPDESTMPQYKPKVIKTEEDIIADAKDALSEYEYANKKQIHNQYDEKFEQLDLDERKMQIDFEKAKTDAAVATEQELEQNQAEKIAQGLERSSIKQNSEREIVSQFDRDLLALIDEKQIAISELELKRTMVQNDLEAALDKFDIAYAAKLENKIEELTKKYDQDVLDLEKYNLKIAELRNARNAEWLEWVEQKTSQIDATKSRKKVEYLVNIIKTLTREETQELMNDQEIIDSLGDYYQIVVDFANRRR